MDFSNCCYTLEAICCHDDVNTHFRTKTPLNWRALSSRMEMHLELGKNMGRLCCMIYCPCCGAQRYDYFFSNTENDHILNCMAPMTCSNNCIRIFLPNGDLGLFSLNSDMDSDWWYANDSYVLNVAAIDNENNPNEFTLELLFDTLHGHIKLRTAWRKLYFRCFRKAFHPEQSQGKRLIAQWDTIC